MNTGMFDRRAGSSLILAKNNSREKKFSPIRANARIVHGTIFARSWESC